MCSKVHNNLCYREDIRNAFSTEIDTNFGALLEKIQCIYADCQENSDPDIFYSNFHNEIVCKSQIYFDIDYSLADIASTKLFDRVFCFVNKRKKVHCLQKRLQRLRRMAYNI